MMSVSGMADAIKAALGNPVDKDGVPVATTAEMTAYANAVVTTLSAGLVSNAPGTVTAVGAPAAPVTLGTAAGGLVAGLLPATFLGILTSAFVGANPAALSTNANGSATYLMASSIVAFLAGSITGTCTATPTSPGILAAGAGANGVISGLAGAAWSTAVAAAGPLGAAVYTAITAHIMANAKATYATATVVGVFAAGGGPMTLGAGTGGTIA